MKLHEADAIALRLRGAWPRSVIAPETWIAELTELDRARAEEACRQLVRSEEHAPSIARFLATYRNLAGTAPDDQRCPECQNTGWVVDNNHPAHWRGTPDTIPKIPDHYLPDDGCLCEAVRPCTCRYAPRGRRRLTAPAATDPSLPLDF